MEFDIEKLSNAQLDRLHERLMARADQRKGERDAADRERLNPRPLRSHIGDAGIQFGNQLGRHNWDRECLDALEKQTVRFAVAPGTTVLARDGKRLGAGTEIVPAVHIDARLGDPLTQIVRLVEQGFILERAQ